MLIGEYAVDKIVLAVIKATSDSPNYRLYFCSFSNLKTVLSYMCCCWFVQMNTTTSSAYSRPATRPKVSLKHHN